jgi:energy-coupling factor transporter ATP-binding protein EcfA2
MDLNNIGDFTLEGLSTKNIILGKNGCGKSHLLRLIESSLKGREGFGRIRYISPERGGFLKYDPGIDAAITQNPTWMEDQRRRNQADSFRQQSATLFRRLELLVLREIETEHTQKGYVPRNFGETLARINILLDRVHLDRDDVKAFKIVNRDTGKEATPETISSGESELISLGIEFLVFVKECNADKNNVLLVDEPDVHLHPDLQDRLCQFIVATLKKSPVTLILATHSTALLAGLAERAQTQVAFMQRKQYSLTFKTVSDVDRAILPVCGAHPLSNVFNQSPLFLIEGEDDERVWQQAVRSASGHIRIFPCVVDGTAHFSEFEMEANKIIGAVYDNACAYSLRDRDLDPELIDDVGYIVRMRLSCRAAENLMLSNEALSLGGTNWNILQEKIRQWVEANRAHQYHAEVLTFIDLGLDRKGHDMKSVRNIIICLITNKPWEVLVGQAIAKLAKEGGQVGEGSLRDFLGEKVCRRVLRLD